MSSFTENTNISPLPKCNKWITTRQFTYYLVEEGGESVTVPAGFEFDGASVPMVFGMFIQRVEPQTISAACLHDYLYTDGRRYTRVNTDKIFRESLLVSGVNKYKAIIMYIGVRLGGWIYWNSFIYFVICDEMTYYYLS